MCPEGNSVPSKAQTISCLNSQPSKNSWPLSSRNGKRVVSFSSRKPSLPSSYSQLFNYSSGSCAAASPQLVWARTPPWMGRFSSFLHLQGNLIPPWPGSEGQQTERCLYRRETKLNRKFSSSKASVTQKMKKLQRHILVLILSSLPQKPQPRLTS